MIWSDILSTHLHKLVDALVTEPEVYLYEQLQQKLVERTTLENYKQVIQFMLQHENTSELDLSMYILDISAINPPGLLVTIDSLLEQFTDQDAIEDLEDARKNISG